MLGRFHHLMLARPIGRDLGAGVGRSSETTLVNFVQLCHILFSHY